jgi:hypothetical protein
VEVSDYEGESSGDIAGVGREGRIDYEN